MLLTIVGGAVLLGLYVDLPGLGKLAAAEESKLKQLDEDNFRQSISAPNRLTVLNLMVEGQPDAEKLRKILEQLQDERKYGNQVAFAELNLKREEALGNAQQVDLEKFAGQLDFYAGGYKLGSLKGPTDRPEVEETIERYLEGLVKRFGPGWLPDVEGMQRSDKDTPVIHVQPADPVPGMTPAPKPARP
jgi:hypothetical protein